MKELLKEILEECYWTSRTVGCSNCPYYENCPLGGLISLRGLMILEKAKKELREV